MFAPNRLPRMRAGFRTPWAHWAGDVDVFPKQAPMNHQTLQKEQKQQQKFEQLVCASTHCADCDCQRIWQLTQSVNSSTGKAGFGKGVHYWTESFFVRGQIQELDTSDSWDWHNPCNSSMSGVLQSCCGEAVVRICSVCATRDYAEVVKNETAKQNRHARK